jgi:hypothetical protein
VLETGEAVTSVTLEPFGYIMLKDVR